MLKDKRSDGWSDEHRKNMSSAMKAAWERKRKIKEQKKSAVKPVKTHRGAK